MQPLPSPALSTGQSSIRCATWPLRAHAHGARMGATGSLLPVPRRHGRTNRPWRPRGAGFRLALRFIFSVLLLVSSRAVAGQEPVDNSVMAAAASDPRRMDVNLPEPGFRAPIVVTADSASRWDEGAYEVWLLEGNCRIAQDESSVRSREAVLWIDRAAATDRRRSKVIAYMEGEVILDIRRAGRHARLADKSWLGRFYTGASVQVHVGQVSAPRQPVPGIYQRAMTERKREIDGAVEQAQFQSPVPSTLSASSAPSTPPVRPPTPPGATAPAGTRVLKAYSRSDVPINIRWRLDDQTGQNIGTVDCGVQLLIYGQTVNSPRGPVAMGPIDISTDRMVIWTRGEEPDLSGARAQQENLPLEIYMEGNIIFRQGERTIFADRMYYDVRSQVGMVLQGELQGAVPQFEGLLRLRAEVIQQLGPDHFLAHDAFITSSRMGAPGYRLQMSTVTINDQQQPLTDPFTGVPITNPETGEPVVSHQRELTGQSNVIYLEDVPVFYWPYFATDLSDSTLYISRAQFKDDSIFGMQFLTDWNMYELLGIRNKPVGTKWDISLDYLSARGFGYGTNFKYDRPDFFGIEGHSVGMIDFWGISDDGLDNLGLGRRALTPEESYRYRLFAQHREILPDGFQLSVELGSVSDRNFLEQYFQREYDELKDESSDVELKKIDNNMSWNAFASARLEGFVTQTEWLPKLDHYWLGQPLLNDTFTWYEHTSLGFAKFQTLEAPPPATAANPDDVFRYLPWEISPSGQPLNANSARAVTRQELDWPFQAGPVKIVPYALGELAYWSEDLSGDALERAYSQVGVRANMPMWRVDPDVQSTLFNVNGLAHKVNFDFEFAWTDVNKDLNQLPLYDPLDDYSIEAFRRRFVPLTFPANPPLNPAFVVPPQFDERYYAVRTGMAGWVTAPSMEVAEDLMAMRFEIENRWQTKRGAPGDEHIMDWITLDTEVTFFPKDSQNFGSLLGLLDYDFRWQVGDRLALLSSGAFDFFEDGQKVITGGVFLDRPPRGGMYVGLRYLDGPIHNLILTSSYSYRMSDKWVAAAGATVDLFDTANVGETLTITRVGEAFLVSTGFTFNSSQGTWGYNLTIEPRFLPGSQLGQAGGARIPVAGATGLE